uniref:ribosomal protein L2 n=1 Tax=Phytopythium vexans TaxID=907947 RepID=UPI0020288D41|nr:ribosomal protein L2 [Phytopythium vexans]YP_010395061.1 ribosomal protein L2 [Phytopythium vexans]DAZ89468.1 TPA_asm: ribosomal protein L2 [Phytopythium vexans]DAZ89498.1 TPA_asm: ribosomal protein L2 [Phytopythium vexans]
MIEKKINPITPSQRQTVLLKKNDLSKKFKIKKLIKGFKRSNGRNNQGRITVRHRGGGHKRLYRKISFNRSLKNVKGFVKKIVYDPNRSANIAYIENDIESFFILAPEGLKINQHIESSPKAELKIGNALPLRNIPIGSLIHNISLNKNSKGKLIRSAGTSGQLIQKIEDKYAKIRLSSGELKLILLSCYATLGIVSNINFKKIKLGKAGRSRWLNRRPVVRGVAKNPVDHPHGGGEGKTSGGRPSVTPQGKITKGKPTRKKNKKKLIIQ